MNERGFIYPLTMIVCFVMIAVIFTQVDEYLTEKYFTFEQERILQLNSLMQFAVYEFKREAVLLERGDKQIFHFSYDEGTATIEVVSDDEDFSVCSIRARLNTGHSRTGGFHYYWETESIGYYWEVSKDAT